MTCQLCSYLFPFIFILLNYKRSTWSKVDTGIKHNWEIHQPAWWKNNHRSKTPGHIESFWLLWSALADIYMIILSISSSLFDAVVYPKMEKKATGDQSCSSHLVRDLHHWCFKLCSATIRNAAIIRRCLGKFLQSGRMTSTRSSNIIMGLFRCQGRPRFSLSNSYFSPYGKIALTLYCFF